MVGQIVIKTGMLETKQPSTATIGRGWRYQAWKKRQVELIQESDGSVLLKLLKNDVLKQVVPLENVQEVKHVASKTHVHAFDVVSESKSVIILSGCTELESRDWIWTLKKIFRPKSASEREGNLRVRLLANEHTRNLNLEDGDCEMRVSVSDIAITSAVGALQTPVQPFTDPPARERLLAYNWPLTTIGRFSLDEDGRVLTIECTADAKCGVATFQFESFQDRSVSMEQLLDHIKLAVFAATNNLHDCISSTNWEFS